ncbi:unnamed protein product [Rhizophagus irregularis]|nr:unnamed protein product [Rhizophagus irregularis]
MSLSFRMLLGFGYKFRNRLLALDMGSFGYVSFKELRNFLLKQKNDFFFDFFFSLFVRFRLLALGLWIYRLLIPSDTLG